MSVKEGEKILGVKNDRIERKRENETWRREERLVVRKPKNMVVINFRQKTVKPGPNVELV